MGGTEITVGIPVSYTVIDEPRISLMTQLSLARILDHHVQRCFRCTFLVIELNVRQEGFLVTGCSLTPQW